MRQSSSHIVMRQAGAMLFALLLCSARPAVSQTEHVIYTFDDNVANGIQPLAGLIADASGNLYGTTSAGGTGGGCGGTRCGTVFELSPPTDQGGAWTETVLYSFQGFNQFEVDGAGPEAPLVFDSGGNLYGSTAFGGDFSESCGVSLGCGIVYQLTPQGGAWAESVLWVFAGGVDGNRPASNLVFDHAGNLYGTTMIGGGTGCGGAGCGSVFELSPPSQTGGAWTETRLYSFQGGRDGIGPKGTIIIDTKGNLYGTTQGGGRCSTCGIVFKLIPPSIAGGAWTERVMHYFNNNSSDGVSPASGPVFRQGSLYGTTQFGGQLGQGTIYQLTQSAGQRTENVLYNFGNDSDATQPVANVIFDNKGNIYGTSSLGGSAGTGTVFELEPPIEGGGNWTEVILHSFTGGTDGGFPDAGLLLRKGVLYGTTPGGGGSNAVCNLGCGVVFAITQ